jgi:Uma2 family endonuclease
MPRTSAGAGFETMGEVLERLGRIDPARVRVRPAPGKATEKDLLATRERTGRLYELVDGTLVEKVMGHPESLLASWLSHLIQSFLDQHDLGIVAGADGAVRLMPGLVRLPDISFVSWDRVPVRGQFPTEPISGLAPDLAVEVLSEENTPEEMKQKLKEYFLAGVRLVWFVDLAERTVTAYTGPDRSVALTEGQTLDGGEVLPGFSLPLDRLFARVPRGGTSPRRKGTRRSAKGKRKGGGR